MSIPSIKILVSYHKPSNLLKSNIFVPIHLGRDLSEDISKDGSLSSDDFQWLVNHMIGDNTGDNISKLNREYCELTAIYWAWKNYDKIGNPEYIGMMHYRRHFIFNNIYINENINKIDSCNMIRTEYIDDNYMEKIGLNDLIFESISSNNCIVCGNTLNYSPHEYHKNLKFLNQKNYDNTLNYIIEHSDSTMKFYIKKYLNGKKHYWSNMFIVPRKVFFDFCEWLFYSLFDVYKIVDFTNASISERRYMGYLAESLFGAYWEYLSDKGYNIIDKPVSFVEHPENIKLIEDPLPNNVYICYSSDNNYIKYLSVSIKSIYKNSSKEKIYNVFILENDIDNLYKERLIKEFLCYKNIKIEFININYLLDKYQDKINSTYEWYTPAIYYRYFIPEVFKNFEKIIYLDCDTLIVDDISKLYDIYLDDYAIGACIDIERRRWLKDSNLHNKTIEFDKRLNIIDSMKYFNSGVCIFNIQKMIHLNTMRKCIDLTGKMIKNGWIGDQDILNSICYNNVKYIDNSWNIMIVVSNRIKDWAIELDEESYKLYKDSLKTPKIIHYCDKQKPWNDISILYSDLWWIYAKDSSFFIDIMDEYFNKKYKFELVCDNYKNNTNKICIGYELNKFFKNKLKLIRYRILKEILFGKKKIYYKLKYIELKKYFNK